MSLNNNYDRFLEEIIQESFTFSFSTNCRIDEEFQLWSGSFSDETLSCRRTIFFFSRRQDSTCWFLSRNVLQIMTIVVVDKQFPFHLKIPTINFIFEHFSLNLCGSNLIDVLSQRNHSENISEYFFTKNFVHQNESFRDFPTNTIIKIFFAALNIFDGARFFPKRWSFSSK